MGQTEPHFWSAEEEAGILESAMHLARHPLAREKAHPVEPQRQLRESVGREDHAAHLILQLGPVGKARDDLDPVRAGLIDGQRAATSRERQRGSDLALDPAWSEFYREGVYDLSRENRMLSSEAMVDEYSVLSKDFPIYSVEDGLAEDDWSGW